MTRHEQHQRTWAVHICINLAIYISIGLPHDRAHAGRGMLTCGRGAGVDIGRHNTLARGCVGCVGARITLTRGDVGAGIGGQGLLTHGHVGADMGTLGVWTGGAPSIGGLLAVLLVLLFVLLFVVLLVVLLIMLLIVLLIVLFIVLFGMLGAVFILLGVFVLRLLVLIRCFILVVFIPFILGFIGATSPVALGSGSRDGLSTGVVVGWCGLLARGATKGSTWGCDADAAGGQHALSTNIEIKEQ